MINNDIQAKRIGVALILFVLFISFIWVTSGYSQTQRNPVLEFCTGTW